MVTLGLEVVYNFIKDVKLSDLTRLFKWSKLVNHFLDLVFSVLFYKIRKFTVICVIVKLH